MSSPIATPLYYLGSITLNVTDDAGVDWIVEEEDGWSSSPPVKAFSTERAAGDGAWTAPGFWAARVINLAGRAIAPDRMSMLAAKDRIKRSVNPRTELKLTVEEAHLTRVAAVRLTDQVDLADKGARSFTWSMTLTAGDPRRYEAAPTTTGTRLPVFGTEGRTYNRTYPIVYPAITTADPGRVMLEMVGDCDLVPALITIFGPVDGPRVEHIESGRSLAFNLNLGEGEQLVIDLAAKTAMTGAGTASRTTTITRDSSWFMLMPGWNEVRFRGIAGAISTPAPSVTCTVDSGVTWLDGADADAADIAVGDVVQLQDTAGNMKQTDYFQVTAITGLGGGVTRVEFTPAAEAPVVIGDRLRRISLDFPRMEVTTRNAWT